MFLIECIQAMSKDKLKRFIKGNKVIRLSTDGIIKYTNYSPEYPLDLNMDQDGWKPYDCMEKREDFHDALPFIGSKYVVEIWKDGQKIREFIPNVTNVKISMYEICECDWYLEGQPTNRGY